MPLSQTLETILPRYYFHMKSKQSNIQDETGKVLASTWEAYVRARDIIRKCLQHCDIKEDEQWMIKVCNEAGHAELVVLFPKPYLASRANAPTSAECAGVSPKR
jgi:Domain of unknown function (DUF6894)